MPQTPVFVGDTTMNLPRRTTLLAAVLATLAVASGCATTPAPATIADTAARTPQLSTLNKLIADAGLADTLRAAGPYTVFAPSDEAFKPCPPRRCRSSPVTRSC
jgi:uncharacterized surface protein with fasciclin (FAS1) repeats